MFMVNVVKIFKLIKKLNIIYCCSSSSSNSIELSTAAMATASSELSHGKNNSPDSGVDSSFFP